MRTTSACSAGSWLVAFVLLLSPLAATAWADEQPGTVRLWDTVTPLGGKADVMQRTTWRPVTTAASGRLQGDLVVETDGLVAAFASRLGMVLVYGSTPPQGEAAIRPAELFGKQAVIASTTVAEQNGAVLAEADFRAPGRPASPSRSCSRVVASSPSDPREAREGSPSPLRWNWPSCPASSATISSVILGTIPRLPRSSCPPSTSCWVC